MNAVQRVQVDVLQQLLNNMSLGVLRITGRWDSHTKGVYANACRQYDLHGTTLPKSVMELPLQMRQPYLNLLAVGAPSEGEHE